MPRRRYSSLLSGAAVIASPAFAAASASAETTTYHYDALGRLTSTQKVGGPGQRISNTSDDLAEKRVTYQTTGAPTPTPTPTGVGYPPCGIDDICGGEGAG